jgi:hypothetical protein
MAVKGKESPEFTKEQYLCSERFTHKQKDILSALLEDGKAYTTEEVDGMMKAFLEKEVK